MSPGYREHPRIPSLSSEPQACDDLEHNVVSGLAAWASGADALLERSFKIQRLTEHRDEGQLTPLCQAQLVPPMDRQQGVPGHGCSDLNRVETSQFPEKYGRDSF